MPNEAGSTGIFVQRQSIREREQICNIVPLANLGLSDIATFAEYACAPKRGLQISIALSGTLINPGVAAFSIIVLRLVQLSF